MRKQIGPVVLIDTDPERQPYTRWDGNQATYLFFPVFVSFVLVLMSGLSEPIVAGLSVVKVDTGVNGTLSFGTWGWCVKGAPGVDDFCSPDRGFSQNYTHHPIETYPNNTMIPLEAISQAIPASYLIANGIFHVFGALATWLTVTWTLAASGNWHNKVENAYDWTRFSFHGTGASALFILISWALDLAMITRVSGKAVNADGSQPSVTPGPAIWMMMTAFILCFGTYLTRLFYLRRLPRPQWTVKGASGDFHNPHPPPLSAALPHPDEQPPTWESLDINTSTSTSGNIDVAVDEKANYVLEDAKDLEDALDESRRFSGGSGRRAEGGRAV